MGLFITFEGIEGSGKSTQVKLLKEYLDQRGIPNIVIREPGGTIIGEKIRDVLLDRKNENMCLETELLLYAASRAQLVKEVIEPELRKGKVVICDRYIDSSVVYQGYPSFKDKVLQINQLATNYLLPTRTYLLDIPVELSYTRLKMRGIPKDRIENKGKAYHHRVREAYLDWGAHNPSRFMIIDASKPIEEVAEEIQIDFKSFSKLPCLS